MSREFVVGLYGDSNAAVNDPRYLDTLQKEIGLKRIIFGGGLNLSPKTRALNPFKGGGSPQVTIADDDTPVKKALDAAHKKGIQVWGIFGGYHGGAENAPELMAYSITGKRMDEYPRYPFASEQGGMVFCPNNERLNDWYEAALVEAASLYEFQGTALTHVRYAHPAFFEQLLGCGCPTCQKKAAEWGYDFNRMKTAVLGTLEALKRQSATRLKAAANISLGFVDFLNVLGQDGGGVADWLNFRAEAITRNMKRFSAAIHAVKPDFLFGMDIHYPTMALLVGHNYPGLASACDQILPLLSHNEIHFLDNIGTFATLLTQWVNGLSEADAVSLVYNFLGIRIPTMPKTVAAMQLGNPISGELKLEALQDVVANEMYKARLFSGEKILSYPVIKGSHWSEKTVRRLMEVAREAGHDGIVLQGTDSLFKPVK